MDRKEVILETISEVVKLMKDPCSFRMFMQNLGLESKDYEDLYNAGGMYLTNLSSEIEESNLIGFDYVKHGYKD